MRNKKIIAVDFDGTLSRADWPCAGDPNWPLIEYLKARQREGSKLILWTCRSGEALERAISWCRDEIHLTFDAVNDNVPEVVARYGNNSRKISCDLYIDDQACEPELLLSGNRL